MTKHSINLYTSMKITMIRYNKHNTNTFSRINILYTIIHNQLISNILSIGFTASLRISSGTSTMGHSYFRAL